MEIPIVMLHGWNSHPKKWDEVVKLLEQKGFKVYIPQQPGFVSDTPRPWSLDDYVKWLSDEFAKLRISQAILVCHSNGGRIGMKFALLYPGKVKRLFLVNSAGIRTIPTWKRRFVRAVAKTGKIIINWSSIRKIFYRFVREHDYEKASPTLKKTMINILEENLNPIFGKIEVPVYLVWGRMDQLTPAKSALILHKSIPNSKLFWVSDAKHGLPFTHAEELVRLITKNVK